MPPPQSALSSSGHPAGLCRRGQQRPSAEGPSPGVLLPEAACCHPPSRLRAWRGRRLGVGFPIKMFAVAGLGLCSGNGQSAPCWNPVALLAGRGLPPTPGGAPSPLLPEAVRGPVIQCLKRCAEEMRVVGPGCPHRPLERNLPALGIDPLPAFLRLPASRSFETEGLSGGAQAGLRGLWAHRPAQGPGSSCMLAGWLGYFSSLKKIAKEPVKRSERNYKHITKQDNTRFAALK